MVLVFVGLIVAAGLHVSTCVGQRAVAGPEHGSHSDDHVAADSSPEDHAAHDERCPVDEHRDHSEHPTAAAVRMQHRDDPGRWIAPDYPDRATESTPASGTHATLDLGFRQAAPPGRSGRQTLRDHCISRT
jgi:hypothetical protein